MLVRRFVLRSCSSVWSLEEETGVQGLEVPEARVKFKVKVTLADFDQEGGVNQWHCRQDRTDDSQHHRAPGICCAVKAGEGRFMNVHLHELR